MEGYDNSFEMKYGQETFNHVVERHFIFNHLSLNGSAVLFLSTNRTPACIQSFHECLPDSLSSEVGRLEQGSTPLKDAYPYSSGELGERTLQT